jgi:DNA-binding NarL/FixJ family response regulator
VAQGEPTRVFLVDASQLVTEGLRVVLQRTQRFRVAGTAHSAGEALRGLRALLVDLVITDIDVPGAAPLQTVRDARDHRPRSPVVVLSGTDASEWVGASLDLGASAYLLKTTPVAELLSAIAEVLRGRSALIDRRVGEQAQMLPRLPPRTALENLSAREFDVLAELVKGLDNHSIANRLFISTDTVKSHVKSILRKLGARDRAHAVAIVLGRGVPHR